MQSMQNTLRQESMAKKSIEDPKAIDSIFRFTANKLKLVLSSLPIKAFSFMAQFL
jgi:hypothetical protein